MTNPHLIEFIQSFNTHEIKVVEEYLEKMGAPEEMRFFSSVVSNEQKISEEELLGNITIDRAGLQSIKNSLFNKISEALLSDKHIYNEAVFINYFQNLYKLNKRLILINILFQTSNQGRNKILNSLIDETISIAKEYESYNVLVEVYSYKKYNISIRSANIQNFNKLNEQIDFYQYCSKALRFANDCYYRIMLNDASIKSLSKNDLILHIKKYIQQVDEYYKNTKSQQIYYYLLIMKINLYDYQKKYLKIIKYCKEIISLLLKNKLLYSKERMGLITLHLSKYKTFNENYKEAVVEAIESRKYYIRNSLSYIATREQEFHACFYGGEYEQAEKCIYSILKHAINDLGEFRYAIFTYYHFCTLFLLKKYKEAASILIEPLEIEKDKSGWNIAVRILKIMLFVELNKLDEASTALEALRKYMERITKSKTEVDARTVLIVKLLRELEKNNFVFDPKNAAASKLLKTLSAKNKPISWEHYTPEMIKFHDWVGRSYEL